MEFSAFVSSALLAATSALTAASGDGNTCCAADSSADANGVTNKHISRSAEIQIAKEEILALEELRQLNMGLSPVAFAV